MDTRSPPLWSLTPNQLRMALARCEEQVAQYRAQLAGELLIEQEQRRDAICGLMGVGTCVEYYPLPHAPDTPIGGVWVVDGYGPGGGVTGSVRLRSESGGHAVWATLANLRPIRASEGRVGTLSQKNDSDASWRARDA